MVAPSSIRRPALFGLVTRALAVLQGAVLAGVVVVSIQLPIVNQVSTATTSLGALAPSAAGAGGAPPIAWPRDARAALVIPSLGVQRTWHDAVVPIASLTKLMTAYVVLQKMPLQLGQRGRCVTINRGDVAYYDTLVATDQSSAAVAVGEVLCENTLLDGLLVHSASNFATILANMVAGGTTAFVGQMNADARSLGLVGTHYVDASGFDTGSVSTALDQGILASLLMKSALVRSIVDQASVTLPVAGTLGSYTPYVGVDNVVGVKSGLTYAAGGCDVMAMAFELNGQRHLAYAVVLGVRGPNYLGLAGADALAVERSVLGGVQTRHLAAGTVVGTLGWGTRRTNVVVATPVSVEWLAALPAVNLSVTINPQRSAVVPGQVVGWLNVSGDVTRRVPLTVARAVSPPTLIERLR